MAIEIKDTDRFNKIVTDAIAACGDNRRWIRAIWKAVREIEENGMFMTWDAEGQHLVIWSQHSDLIYTANGVCQCYAYEKGVACYHRAAARLIRLYMNNETPKAAPANRFAELVAERRYAAKADAAAKPARRYWTAARGWQEEAPASFFLRPESKAPVVRFGRFRI